MNLFDLLEHGSGVEKVSGSWQSHMHEEEPMPQQAQQKPPVSTPPTPVKTSAGALPVSPGTSAGPTVPQSPIPAVKSAVPPKPTAPQPPKPPNARTDPGTIGPQSLGDYQQIVKSAGNNYTAHDIIDKEVQQSMATRGPIKPIPLGESQLNNLINDIWGQIFYKMPGLITHYGDEAVENAVNVVAESNLGKNLTSNKMLRECIRYLNSQS